MNKTKGDLFFIFFNTLNEAEKRRFAAFKAREIGWGGITEISKLTGLTYKTIRKGIDELESGEIIGLTDRIRKKGGGQKRIEEKDPGIINDLERIMDENTAGDPMSCLKWTNKSTYQIASELQRTKHKVGPDTVARLLKERNYSLQANVKTIEGGSGTERNEQFNYINHEVKRVNRQGNPVISVDTKKRENVGKFKNNGRTWEKRGEPQPVNVYDFRSLAKGIAIPYGIFDIFNNDGFVNVGISRDTSEFAVESIHQWWKLRGQEAYSNSTELLICADGGGSNGSRRRGWKIYLQEFSDQIDMKITVCHLPPGTSKWNKIEHRMFSFISINWKGKPLVDYKTIINLISSTKTSTGLTILARLDDREYEGGRKFTKEELGMVNLHPHSPFPQWNYSILPRL